MADADSGSRASSSPPADGAQGEQPGDEAGGLLAGLVSELSSPLHLALICLIAFLVYKIVRTRQSVPDFSPPDKKLPKLRRDFTVQELRKYNGTQEDGRVLVAVNGNVFDVTKGKKFYGPDGPYSAFGGKDASRGLATFQVAAGSSDDYDDLSDLNSMEMDSVREWDSQFKEKYELVGKLLKPGEQPNSYSDEEDESATPNTTTEGEPSAPIAAAAAAEGDPAAAVPEAKKEK